MKEINVYDLEQLADGVPPDRVRQGWDCATVIPWLAQSLLGVLVDEMTIGLKGRNELKQYIPSWMELPELGSIRELVNREGELKARVS